MPGNLSNGCPNHCKPATRTLNCYCAETRNFHVLVCTFKYEFRLFSVISWASVFCLLRNDSICPGHYGGLFVGRGIASRLCCV